MTQNLYTHLRKAKGTVIYCCSSFQNHIETIETQRRRLTPNSWRQLLTDWVEIFASYWDHATTVHWWRQQTGNINKWLNYITQRNLTNKVINWRLSPFDSIEKIGWIFFDLNYLMEVKLLSRKEWFSRYKVICPLLWSKLKGIPLPQAHFKIFTFGVFH